MLELARETVRSFRQSCRVARYLYGRRWRSNFRKKKFWPYFLRQMGHNFYGGTFWIGCVGFPSDPSKPFMHRYYG